MSKLALFLLLPLLFVLPSTPGEDRDTGHKETAKNIILMIGDGMGVAQVSAAMTMTDGNLNLGSFKEIGFSRTSAADDYVTDSGAGGTAIATGYKTYSKAIGVDRDTVPRPSILEIAEHHGKATGLVVTSQVTHATPASFVAHQETRYHYEEIADDILASGIDVFIGGGLDHFNHREDGQDLIPALKSKGYQVLFNLQDLQEAVPGKVAGLLYPDAPPSFAEGRGNMLPVAVAKTIELLADDKDGFFLLVEGSQIDWGGHDREVDYMLEELLDFDRAVGEALDFARRDGNTLVIVTADHETGGMSILDGDAENGSVEAAFSTSSHTGVMVPVFSYGPGAEKFMGIYENTDLFGKMMKAFGFREGKIRS